MGESHSIKPTLYLSTLIFFVISLPLSLFTLSIASYLLVLFWITWDVDSKQIKSCFSTPFQWNNLLKAGKYCLMSSLKGVKKRTLMFYRNKPALVFSLLFFIRIIWLWNTKDVAYAQREIRVDLPLLFFPMLFSSFPKINGKQLRIIFLFYLAALLSSSLISTYILFDNNFSDIRQISPFIASIRLGLNLTFGIFIALWFVVKDDYFTRVQKIGFLILTGFFLMVLFFLESVTAFVILFIIGMIFLVCFIFLSKKIILKISLGILFLLIPSLIYLFIQQKIIYYTTPQKIDVSKLDRYSAKGNAYQFDTVYHGIENGKYIGLYLCLPELKEAWNQRSTLPFSGLDKKKQQISETLIRYLTSKNLRKDAEGVASLTEKDIKHIENGVANYNYIAHPGINSRLMKMITGYEVYQKTGNPSGSSFIQRIVYIRASLNIIKNYFWTGVGTGDVKQAFYQEFRNMNSGLKDPFMHLAHNQFLEAFAAFGIIGFLLFVFALFYPPLVRSNQHDYFFILFYSIMILSMFSDNTLETPDGVYLFAFFSNLFLFGRTLTNKKTPLG